jgi:hypothetical protein
MKKFIVIAIILWSSIAYAKHINVERHYQDIWCAEQNGQVEVIMKDGTRCDCLTKDMATEVDFARKFYEGIGQALHYSMLTGRPGGLLLIVEQPSDWKYVDRARDIVEFYNLPITVYTIQP